MIGLAGSAAWRRQWAGGESLRWRAVVQVGGQDGIAGAAATMAEAAQRLSTAMAGQQSHLISEVIRSFQEEALAPLTARLEESAAISRQTAEAVATLESSLGGITTRLATSVEVLDRFNQQTHEKLQDFTDNMATTLDRFQAGSQAALQETGTAIKEAVGESITGMARQREAFEHSAEVAAQTFQGIRTELESALTTQSAEQRKTLTTLRDANLAVIERAEQTYTRQAEAIEQIGQQTVKTMTIAGQELQHQLADVRAAITQTSTVVQEELTQFRAEYSTQLRDFLTHQTHQLDDVLDRHRKGLTGVIDRLESCFGEEYDRRKELSGEVDIAIRRLKEGVEILDNLAVTLGLNSEARLAQLITLSEQMSGQTESLEQSYRALAVQYEGAITNMDGASTRLCEGLYRAADTLVTASRRVA